MDLQDPRLQHHCTGDFPTGEPCKACEQTGDKAMWKLVHTTPIECTMDDSGVYTIIRRIQESDTHKGYIDLRVSVRCDVMTVTYDEPLISFQGSANDVRKHVIHWISIEADLIGLFTTEHASYIGWELHRAETDPNYIQD